MRRVVIVSPAAGLGGAERVLLDVVEGTIRRPAAPEPIVLAMEDGPLIARLERLGVRSTLLALPPALAATGESGFVLRQLPMLSSQLAVYARRFDSALRELRPDLVHTNGLKAHVITAIVRRRAPISWHLHDFVGDRRASARLLRTLSGRADLAIANSHAVAEDARGILGALPIRTVHNGVDLTRFHAGAVDAAGVLGGPRDIDVRVGLIATYARWKGQDVFLRAIAEAKRSCDLSRARFFVIGGPIYRTAGSQWSERELAELAESLGVRELVHFVPFVEDPADVYRALDVVVHASTQREPFGRTIVEAMATGKAVIVTRGGGADELYTEGTDALATEARDPVALARAITALLRDPELRSRLGAAAIARARGLSVERFVDGVIAAWEGQLARPARG